MKQIVLFCVIFGLCLGEVVQFSTDLSTWTWEERRTNTYGGDGGESRQWAARRLNYEVVKVNVRHGRLIDQLNFELSNADTRSGSVSSPTYGGSGGDFQSWTVPSGEHINKIILRSGGLVDSLTFCTDKNSCSPKFGENGGSEHIINIPDGFYIIGVSIRSGSKIDKIGFILEKGTAPVIEEEEEEDDGESFEEFQQRCAEGCKLPNYIGSSYDILKGNPESQNEFDPGWRSPVFVLSYEDGEKTEDGYYLIPDDVLSRKAQACSLTSKTERILGASSYQKRLSTRAEVSGGGSGKVLEASFSASAGFEEVQEQTSENEKVLVISTANCEYYRQTIGTFETLDLTQNFITAVQYSCSNNNFTRFIAEYGTHFAYDIRFGGYAQQFMEYEFESASRLISQNVDIEAAASFTYAAYHGDASFEYDKYEEENEYAEKEVENVRQVYVGGQPPRDGDINDWVQNVVEGPVPIYSKLSSLENLFEKALGNASAASSCKTAYASALDTYCQGLGCQGSFTDETIPATSFTTKNSNQWGGTGGGTFNWKPSRLKLIYTRIVAVTVRHGRLIDAITVKMSDGVEVQFSPKYGSNGGKEQTWNVPDGEEITQITIRSGRLVDSLQFSTDKGSKSPKFGGDGGSQKLWTVPRGYHLLGIFGRSGRLLDNIGFKYGRAEYDS